MAMRLRLAVLFVSFSLFSTGPLCEPPTFPAEDINGDGRIDPRDQLRLLKEWYVGEINDPTVEFQDATLEAIARRLIEEPTDSIHASDLTAITTIQVPMWMPFQSLVGIDHFRNLRSLSIRFPRGGPASIDLIPLAALKDLQSLELVSIGGFLDQTVDLSPLSDMGNLTNLIVSGDEIKGVTHVGNLENLFELELSNASIADVSFVTDLSNLLRLSLDRNEIVNVSPLVSLIDLRVLELGNNEIIDISPLQSLHHLEWIDLECNGISDIKPLVDNVSLDSDTFLILSGNPLNTTSEEEYIPMLEVKGVGVVFSEGSLCFDFKREDEKAVRYREWKSKSLPSRNAD